MPSHTRIDLAHRVSDEFGAVQSQMTTIFLANLRKNPCMFAVLILKSFKRQKYFHGTSIETDRTEG
jgi:hypothetical protein